MTSNSPPPQKLNFRSVEWQVEHSVDTIAFACGLSPELTGVIMAAIIGGLNRRKPEEVPCLLDGVPTGPNILIIGADENPRVLRLLSMLIPPLTSKQVRLRNAAGACRRDTLNDLQYGPEGGGGVDDPTEDVLDRIKQGPFGDDLLGLKGLNSRPSIDRSLMAANRPSICLANPESDTLLAGLEEALDGQVLVFDEHGDFFRKLATPSRSDRGNIDRIRALLGQQGSDDIMRSQNPRHGPGNLETRRINMVTTISRQQMISLMEQKGSRLRSLLEQFIVVDGTAHLRVPASVPPFKDLARALRSWEEAVSSVYSSRVLGSDAGPCPPEKIADHLLLVAADYHDLLEAKAKESATSLGNLWGLPFQLYLALAIVSQTGGNGLAPVLTNLDGLCAWILENHVNALVRLQNEAVGNELMLRREAILRAIGRRGPCTFRIMLRTFSVQRKDLYEPLVCELIAEGEVIETESGLLSLPAGSKNHLEARERCLD